MQLNKQVEKLAEMFRSVGLPERIVPDQRLVLLRGREIMKRRGLYKTLNKEK